MPTIEQQLNELVKQKNALATALRDKGVEIGENETLNTLVEKVEGLETKTNSLIEEIDYTTASIQFYCMSKTAYAPNATIKELEVPEGVTMVHGSTDSYFGAFAFCRNLEKLILPSTLTGYFGKATFKECYKLKQICFRGTKEQWNKISMLNGWNTDLGRDVEGGTQIIYNYTG